MANNVHRRDLSRWIVWGLYLFAAVLVASPTMDLLSTVWPLRPSDPGWRYGFLGLSAGYLHTPVLGLTLALLVTLWTGRDGLLRPLAMILMLAALILIPAIAMFLSDMLLMRGLREPDSRNAVVVGGLIQVTKLVGASVVLGALGVGAWRTEGRLSRSDGPDRHKGSGIVSTR